MGRGIAQVAAQHGFDGHARRRAARHRRARARRRSAQQLDEAGREGEADRRRARRRSLARIQPRRPLRRRSRGGRLRGRGGDRERQELKREIFEALDQACRGGVDPGDQHLVDLHHRASARRSTRPERVIGMHFMNPLPLMKLVEIIRGLPTGGRDLRDDARAGRAARQDDRGVARHPGLHRQPRADADAQRGLLRALRRARLGRGHRHRRSSSASTTRWGRSRWWT